MTTGPIPVASRVSARWLTEVLESAAVNRAAMADPAATVDDLPAPRRVAIATLFGEILGTERELAALYGGFAPRAQIAYLRAALEELAEAKRARVAALEAMASTLAVDGRGAPAVPESRGARPAPAERRSEVFTRAFEGERALEAAYRELVALLGDPARCPGLVELAVGSARHRALLRDLYLRYS